MNLDIVDVSGIKNQKIQIKLCLVLYTEKIITGLQIENIISLS